MKAFKAYKVSCVDDDHGQTIVFAFRAKDVDRRANSECCDCEFLDVKIRRAPEFDKYSDRPLTIADYLAEGWFWPCHHCDRQLFQDASPLIVGGYVFCSLEHLKQSRASWPKHPAGAHDSVLRFCAEVDAYLDGIGGAIPCR